MSLTILDAHAHVWDLAHSDYAWLDRGSPLHRDWTPNELRQRMTRVGVSRAVLIQADSTVADTEHLLEAADRHDWVAAVVGWLPRDRQGALSALDAWSAHGKLRGIREQATGPSLDPSVWPEIRRRALSVDLLASWTQHAWIRDRVAASPDVAFVLDHLGSPPHAAEGLAEWSRVLSGLASYENVSVKLSGWQGAASVGPPEPTRTWLQHMVDHVTSAFGPDRIAYGSNWPIVDQYQDGYAGSVGVLQSCLAGLSPAEIEQVAGGTAGRIYGCS